MFNYLRESFRRKTARRITREYPSIVQEFILEDEGKVEFANWDNPLVKPIEIRQETVDFFKKFINTGDLAIDIGANIGDTTVPMGLAAGNNGMVLGFDPNPFVFKILKENASLNKEKLNIESIPYAISVEEEEFFFISSEASFSNGGISKTTDSIHGKYIHDEKIKGVNMMDFLEEKYKDWLPKLSFIKVDTEGYDKEILKSITGIIVKYKPSIVAESFGANTEDEKMELFEVIDQHGYKIYQFDEFSTGTLVVHLGNSRDMLQWEKTTNIYAIPNNDSTQN